MTVIHGLSIGETLKLMIVAILVYNILLVVDDLINTSIKEYMGWQDTVWDKLKLAVLVIIIAIIVMFILRINPISILGINLKQSRNINMTERF